ncbi:hypothetical protein [Kutzneria buriramensis]|uniref:Uncharacterized protein n=1 Tax=Kutzneria buriramensis TaxID=1045776 RepID=A0A3E0I988_9PSEU|nr:hypothetical protein [Kutzneria buriramensis]REH55217.1 hypothetical protein BCF44_101234 [Kutzneria buriramensis]
MPIRVQMVRPAAEFRDAMRRRERKAYDQWKADFERRGCAAMGYRMEGVDLDRLCVRHLTDNLRVVVAFLSREEALIIALGPHDETDRRMNIYSFVYQAAECDVPTGKRTKPSCCDTDGFPPVDAELAERLADNIRAMEKAMRRRRS